MRTAAHGAHTRTNPADDLVNDDDDPARVGSDLEVALGEVTAYHVRLTSDGYECPLTNGWCYHPQYNGAVTAWIGRPFQFNAANKSLYFCEPCAVTAAADA